MVIIDPRKAHAAVVHYHFDHEELVAMLKRELAANRRTRDRGKTWWGSIYNTVAGLDGERMRITGVEFSRILFLADDPRHKTVDISENYELEPEELAEIVDAAERRRDSWPERSAK